MKEIIEVAEKIKRLEIQGATSIAISALRAFYNFLKEGPKKEEVLEAYRILKNSRPNEPLMQNFLKILFKAYLEGELEEKYRLLENYIKESKERIVLFASSLVENGDIIGTICHSSLVEESLIFAKNNGKKFTIYALETRPRYQGRITAKNLAKAGIKVKFFVDGCSWRVASECDKIFVGADVLLPYGVINKVGTKTLAILSFFEDTPFFVLSQLLKFRPRGAIGIPEKIEMRDPSEVWEDAPENVEILNYAFDLVPKKYITSLICEEGVISYETVPIVVKEKYPTIFEEFII